MPVPSSGAISLNQFHVEAGGSSGTQCSINDADIRALIGKGSGVQMSFSEWYGASASTPNGSSITCGSYNTTGKYAAQYKGYADTAAGLGSAMGSYTDRTFTVNGKTFDLIAIYSNTGGIFQSHTILITGNYAGQSLQSVTGIRYLRNGSAYVFDSQFNDYLGNAMTSIYNSSQNFTTWSGISSTNTSISQLPTSGTVNFYWSN